MYINSPVNKQLANDNGFLIIFAVGMEEVLEKYSEDSIRTLDWKEHIRRRPGMYIGKLGDGSSQDDGIYVLLKEVVDNSIDEFMMGFGKAIDISISDKEVTVRDYGRGIPLGKLMDVASKMNTGAKYDSKVFKKSVGLNGVGIKAVNALSNQFIIKSVREKEVKTIEFSRGELVSESLLPSDLSDGTIVTFIPDEEIFGHYRYINDYVEALLRNYSFLNSGLSLNFNGTRFYSKNGLLDLLNENMSYPSLYPPIHLKGEDIEVAITHGTHYGEEYYSFVNGQHTTQGGTHLLAFKEAIVKTLREFYKKEFEASDIRTSFIGAISIKVEEPVFESQTKTKLGSRDIGPSGVTVRNFIIDFLKTHLDNFLHKNQEVANTILNKILEAEKERKTIAGVQKVVRERNKRANIYNSKLRDCKIHVNSNDDRKFESTIFITEGDSASGSITKSRDVNTQAVFSLKGKPMNSYKETKKRVYENEELGLLVAALNIEEEIENLRFQNVVIATDADDDGMHIRLLIITFFLIYYPDLIKNGHLFILQTPLFRVRNKKQTNYCYTEQERLDAIKKLGPNPEITRFKGLGEISPDEFKHFIGKNIRLEPVMLEREKSIEKLLRFFMGDNTDERRDFIIENLKIELDAV